MKFLVRRPSIIVLFLMLSLCATSSAHAYVSFYFGNSSAPIYYNENYNYPGYFHTYPKNYHGWVHRHWKGPYHKHAYKHGHYRGGHRYHSGHYYH